MAADYEIENWSRQALRALASRRKVMRSVG